MTCTNTDEEQENNNDDEEETTAARTLLLCIDRPYREQAISFVVVVAHTTTATASVSVNRVAITNTAAATDRWIPNADTRNSTTIGGATRTYIGPTIQVQ